MIAIQQSEDGISNMSQIQVMLRFVLRHENACVGEPSYGKGGGRLALQK